MPFASVGHENSASIDLYYEDHGSGKPVILIHGYPLNGASWEKQIPVLLESGYRVITYDRRGFGQSSKPATGYDYDTFAQDLHRLIGHLDLKDISLVGFSMGGGEVARYIGNYGTKHIGKAAFVSAITPYLLKASDNPEGVDKSVFDGIQKGIAADRYAWFTDFFNNFYNADQLLGTRISEQAIKASWNVAASASPTASYAWVSTWYTDFRQDIAKINIPTLVMHGDADRIVPFLASAARTAKLIPGAKLVIVKNGPHNIAWTYPDEVNPALINFLREEKKLVPAPA